MDRFKSRSGRYFHEKLRRSDFLLVGEEQEDEILQRGYYSFSSDDEEGRDIEHAFGDQASEPEDANDVEVSSHNDNAFMLAQRSLRLSCSATCCISAIMFDMLSISRRFCELLVLFSLVLERRPLRVCCCV